MNDLDKRTKYQKSLPGKICLIKYTKTKGICLTDKQVIGVVQKVTNNDVFVILENGHGIPGSHIYDIEIL